jgi:uncharacterized protein YaeQ
MALTATIYNFDVDLSDNDRSVYETVAIRAAQHPSESGEYLIARVLAYLLEYREGIDFSRGVSEPEEPMISVRDLTGKIITWIDIGTPDSTRLHKASKSAERVVVYCHKEHSQWLKGLAAANIHRADALELYAIDRTLIADLVSRLDRRMAFSVSINDRELYVSIGDVNITGRVQRLML